MQNRIIWLLLICFCAGMTRAADLATTVFVKTPSPAPETLQTPRALAVDPAGCPCYVLDSGLHRVVSFTFAGEPVKTWYFNELGLPEDMPMPADPLLPQPQLAVAQKTVYLLTLNRASRRLDLIAIDGQESSRAVTLPAGAGNGAVALDSGGRAWSPICVRAARIRKWYWRGKAMMVPSPPSSATSSRVRRARAG